MSQPVQSAKRLMEIMEDYGRVSGFKVNISKTKMLVKNLDKKARQDLERITGCEIVKKVKYLGVEIEATNVNLYKNNYEELWNKIQADLERWKTLRLSLLGRIAAVKMNVLPRFLFLFQMLPILKKDVDLDNWQRDINRYIWDGKRPRVKLKIIQDARKRGGLKMPNLKLYYYAATLVALSDWINMTNDRILNVEGHGLLFGWHAYLVYDRKADKNFKENPLRIPLLWVWKKYKYLLHDKIPTWTIPGHTIGDTNTSQGQEVVPYSKLVLGEENGFLLIPQATLANRGIGGTWLSYVQLQSRWRKDKKKGFSQTDEKLIAQIRDQGAKHIKRVYSILIEMDSEPELVKNCMVRWAQDFGHSIPLDTWEKIWVRNVEFTKSQQLRENFYKMFYRWHLDPKKISLIYPGSQPKCWRCGDGEATYFHIWWTCRKIKAFWRKIWWTLQTIFTKRIEFLPQVFLLGITKDITTSETTLFLNLITAARLLVGQYWKNPEIPPMAEWTVKVTNLAEMAKISAYLKGRSNEQYLTDWKQWIDYIQEKHQSNKMHLAFS